MGFMAEIREQQKANEQLVAERTGTNPADWIQEGCVLRHWLGFAFSVELAVRFMAPEAAACFRRAVDEFAACLTPEQCEQRARLFADYKAAREMSIDFYDWFNEVIKIGKVSPAECLAEAALYVVNYNPFVDRFFTVEQMTDRVPAERKAQYQALSERYNAWQVSRRGVMTQCWFHRGEDNCVDRAWIEEGPLQAPCDRVIARG